ncbi:hypothetical protein OAR19_00290 [bacterium]|nr:hypothetical protein [bacterium]
MQIMTLIPTMAAVAVKSVGEVVNGLLPAKIKDFQQWNKGKNAKVFGNTVEIEGIKGDANGITLFIKVRAGETLVIKSSEAAGGYKWYNPSGYQVETSNSPTSNASWVQPKAPTYELSGARKCLKIKVDPIYEGKIKFFIKK